MEQYSKITVQSCRNTISTILLTITKVLKKKKVKKEGQFCTASKENPQVSPYPCNVTTAALTRIQWYYGSMVFHESNFFKGCST